MRLLALLALLALPSLALAQGVQPRLPLPSGTLRPPLSVTDTAATTVSTINVKHYGAGSASAFGFDLHNYPDNSASPGAGAGARTAFSVHQYSDTEYAIQLDNTRSKAMQIWRNTHNETLSTGTHGTGRYVEFVGYTAGKPYVNGTSDPSALGELDADLRFYSRESDTPWAFESLTAAPSLRIYGAYGVGIDFQQTYASPAIQISQAGANSAFTLTTTSGAANYWPMTVAGQNYGPMFSTSTNGADTFTVAKNGTGNGTALKVVNKGTGLGVKIANASVDVLTVAADGTIELLGAGVGILMKSPDGTRYRLTIANGGTVAIAAAP